MSHHFTVDNTGSAPLHLSGTPIVQVAGPHAGDFIVTGQPSRFAFPDTFSVDFRPSGAGQRNATLSIASNAVVQGPFTFSLRGTGVAGAIRVQGLDAQVISNGSTQPSLANNTAFGSANTGGASVLKRFSVSNAGQGSLRLTGSPAIAIGGTNAAEFVVERQAAGTLPPGGSSTFEIRFTPGADGVRVGTVTIASDDPGNATFTFAIKGQGVGGPEIQVLGGSLFDQDIAHGDSTPQPSDGSDFGTVRRDAVVKNRFRIRNAGAGVLVLSGSPLVRIVSTAPTDFRIYANPQASIATGAHSDFTLELAATQLGVQTARIEISSNDADEAVFRFDVRAEVVG